MLMYFEWEIVLKFQSQNSNASEGLGIIINSTKVPNFLE